MSFLANDFAADALPDFEEVLGETCTYARGESSIELTMIPPPAGLDLVDGDGVRIPAVGGPFLCAQADLAFGSVPTTPARGDLITDANGREWDVREWENLADTGQWRIHAQLVT